MNKERYIFLKRLSLLASVLSLNACQQPDLPSNDQQTEQADRITWTSPQDVVAWFTATAPAPSVWAQDVRSVCDSIKDIELLACFSNHLDSTNVYALLRVPAASLDGVNRLNDVFQASCDAYLESTKLDLGDGHGPFYLFVSHSVEDLAEWNTAFMSMYAYKESDSIYTIGVLSGAIDSLHVAVISRTTNLRNAADYADMLESKGILRKAGVSHRKTSMILRRL